MKVEISFEEILGMLRKKVSHPVSLKYVASDTIAVNTSIKVAFIQKNITMNIQVVKIDGTDATLSYSGGMSVDLIVSAVLHFLDDAENIGSLYKQLPNNQLLIHLDKIPQLQSVLKAAALQAITFTDNAAQVFASLK